MSMIWNALAKLAARPAVAGWLIRRAKRTPMMHLADETGDVYMERYWLFNPLNEQTGLVRFAHLGIPWSVRIHRIKRRDKDSHLHNHPWNARSIIIGGFYLEQRPTERDMELLEAIGGYEPQCELVRRARGDTFEIQADSYHRIAAVSPGGTWTIFITGRYRHSWGFLVKGVTIPWRTYLGLK